MRSLLRGFLPHVLLQLYHRIMAWMAALLFRFPGDRLIVIGVTGTNGKSTVVHLIARICEEAGYTVGVTSTVEFQVGKEQKLNNTKMTMLGRFGLQRMLHNMVRRMCEIAVIETSSEGIMQYRHTHIAYDVAVFTNLTPEHIQSHGSYAAYRSAKGELFATLKHTKKKRLNGKKILKTSVVNIGDPEATFFRTFMAEHYVGFVDETRHGAFGRERFDAVFAAKDVAVLAEGSRFTVNGQRASLKLLGEVNVQNALAALAAVEPLGISLETGIRAIAKIEGVPGRFEFVQKKPFAVMVDYAPEPASLTQLYVFLKKLPYKRIVHVLGSTGGGRDISRRPILGKLAAENAAMVIVTNEDPYDDDPMQIIKDVSQGAQEAGKIEGKDLFLILDRREGIAKALSLAALGDLVLVTGKGSEQAMVVAGGRKVPWDDRTVIRELLHDQKVTT
ncbi:MAG: UDP-N-acetylmuramyl-tripeptide synthetase [Patescibacteria group bacterium]|jgi:UDP-N-acetylmuramoyl-L-alanyl-D-glutamate--2,6-diaminopimelate ligase